MTTQEIQGSLRDYLQIIFHRKWYFLMPFVIVFFTATIGSFFLPKYYKSSVLIEVVEEKPVNPLASRELQYMSPTGQPPTLVEQLKTLTEKILSYPHLITLVKTLKLDKGIADQVAYEKLLFGIRNRTDVRMRSPDVFLISYEDKDPVLARDVVRMLIGIFKAENVEKKTREAETAIQFAEKQAEIYKEKLRKSEEGLFNFRAKYPMQLPGKELDYNVSMLTNYQTSLTSVELNLKEAQNKADLVRKQLTGREPVVISADMIDLNPAVTRLNSKLQDLQSKLDTVTVAKPNDPMIPDMQVEIEDTREQLRRETEKMVDSETAQTAPLFYKRLEQKLRDARKDVDDLQARKKNLGKLVKEYEDKIETLPEQERQLAYLTRDTEVSENIYKMLVLKVEENRLTSEEIKQKGTKYNTLDEARLPLKPSRPQILIIGIVAFVLGSLSGFGCVFLAEFADHSFRGVEDARKFLDLPILGAVTTIVDKNELMAKRGRQRVTAVVVIVLYITAFVIAAIFSNMRESEVTGKVIAISNKEKAAEPR